MKEAFDQISSLATVTIQAGEMIEQSKSDIKNEHVYSTQQMIDMIRNGEIKPEILENRWIYRIRFRQEA